ncbi:LptA/OstA family protein [Maricaulis sp.]|uniref:LptA/OstA family protein n=1 Tax=Maricaulis sp. TaxID=1486257 RepID=UPI002636F724|nr:LptA/OstA family protein [Maricaulis sp.]
MRSVLTALAALLLTGAPALAQIGNSDLPLDIESDHVEVFDSENRIVWTGRVVAIQGESTIRAQRLEAFFTGLPGSGGTGGWGDIERIIATRDVLYVTPTQRARGDRGVYDLSSETITLTGDVVINQGDDVITTNRFVTDLVSGNSTFGEAGDGERVRVVITPANDDEAGGEPEGR